MAVMVIRLMVLALICLALWRVGRSGTIILPPFGVSAAVLTFLGLAACSTILSPYTNQSVQWLAVLGTYAALFYLLVSFVIEWDHVAVLLVVLAGTGLFEAGWALWQGWRGASLRPNGTFFNANFLAGYLAMVWAIVLGHACHLRIGRRGWPGGRRGSVVDVAVAAIFLALLLMAIVWTGSRGGLLAVAVCSAVVIGVRFGVRQLSLVALVLILAGLLIPNPLRDRIWAEHAINPIGYARWNMWQQAIRQMTDHPGGVGLGLYQYVYPRYAFPVEGQIARYGNAAQTPHSEYIQMGVELGMASIAMFCGGIVAVVLELRALLGARLRRWQRGLAVGMGAAVASVLAHAAVDSNLHEPAVAIGLTLCVGLMLAARRMAVRTSKPARTVTLGSRWSRLVWAGGGLGLAAGLAFTVMKIGMAWLAYDLGSEALARKDYDRASVEYQHAITLDPGKALYHSALAATHFQSFEGTGDTSRALAAVAELKEAAALNPLDGRLCGLLAQVHVALFSGASRSKDPAVIGQRESWLRAALEAYECAIRLEPFNPFYRLEIARVYLDLGDSGRAQESVEEAVKLEPNFLAAREWLARRHLQAARVDAARDEYREVVERQQQYAAWNKTPYEAQLLRADAAGLAAELEAKKPKT